MKKEMELQKAARESSGREYEQAEIVQKDLEKQLRQKDWELEDVKAMSHARLVTLYNKTDKHAQFFTDVRSLLYGW